MPDTRPNILRHPWKWTRWFRETRPKDEIEGYKFWGPVAAAVTATELIGAFSGKLVDPGKAPWHTISSTIGHLEDLHPWVGLLVVGVIALTGFYAVIYVTKEPAPGTTVSGHETTPLVVRRFRWFRYGWPTVIVLEALACYLGHGHWYFRGEYGLSYLIYLSFLVLGILIPLILASRWLKKHVKFPTLFATMRYLRAESQLSAALVMAGLGILVIHLALYPWPNLAREPATFAGRTKGNAQKFATKKLRAERQLNSATAGKKQELTFLSASKQVQDGREAWAVYFIDPNLVDAKACVVTVRFTTASLGSECLKPVHP